jgi:uncharacterized membrane protein YeiH
MQVQYAIEHVATVFAAISGVMAGRGKSVDLFGVVVLALVTAVGGGTIRDVILKAPVFWVADPAYLITAAIAAVVYFVIARFWQMPNKILLFADAGGLALFSAAGVHKALMYDVSPVVAVAMGVTTGVAGGVIRDVLTNEIPLIIRHQITLYATTSLCGATMFAILQSFADISVAWTIAIGTTLLLRLAAIRLELRLPLFQPK